MVLQDPERCYLPGHQIDMSSCGRNPFYLETETWGHLFEILMFAKTTPITVNEERKGVK